jgi:hypothetical protein
MPPVVIDGGKLLGGGIDGRVVGVDDALLILINKGQLYAFKTNKRLLWCCLGSQLSSNKF